MRIDAGALAFLFLWLAAYPADDHEKEMASLRSEIAEYRAKTEEIRNKIDHTISKATADSIAFGDYMAQHQARSHRLESERDSLQVMVVRLSSLRDSLYNGAQALKLRRNNYRAQSAAVLSAIQSNCRRLFDSLTPLQPYHTEKQISAIRFLEGEMAAGTVGPVEGLERYWQIVGQIEEASQRVETWTGPSPAASLPGNVTYLRLGFVWLACVNNDNTAGLLWKNASKAWLPIENVAQVKDIRTAIQLATGKSAPHLVSLPFSHPFSAVEAEVSK